MPYPSPTTYPGDFSPGPGPFTEGVLGSMAPWLATDASGDHTNYLTALSSMFEQVYDIVSDQGSPDDPVDYRAGWSLLLDVNNCPTEFLPYLACFNGTFVPANTDDATARAIIKAEAGFARGTPTAIVATAQRFLTGTKFCDLLERQPGAYSFVLAVNPSEVLDQQGLVSAVNNVKPAGVVWQLVSNQNWTFNAAVNTFSADTQTFAQAATTQP